MAGSLRADSYAESPISRQPDTDIDVSVKQMSTSKPSPASGSAVLRHHGSIDNAEEPRNAIVRSFSPRVAVFSSLDTEELVRRKGIYGGLCGLLKPFGERLQGHVTIRDSRGFSESVDDFGVRFVPFPSAQDQMLSTNLIGASSPFKKTESSQNTHGASPKSQTETGADSSIEEALRVHLLEHWQGPSSLEQEAASHAGDTTDKTNPYVYFLRKSLSDPSLAPHRMFTYPVACLITVSSQNPTPIESLRDLYSDTRQESKNVPGWVGNEFLRYYVLVHDDDHDDIGTSMSLFNLMKRHFGLHCHLLRLRGTECDSSEQDSIMLPTCEWVPAELDVDAWYQKGFLS